MQSSPVVVILKYLEHKWLGTQQQNATRIMFMQRPLKQCVARAVARFDYMTTFRKPKFFNNNDRSKVGNIDVQRYSTVSMFFQRSISIVIAIVIIVIIVIVSLVATIAVIILVSLSWLLLLALSLSLSCITIVAVICFIVIIIVLIAVMLVVFISCDYNFDACYDFARCYCYYYRKTSQPCHSIITSPHPSALPPSAT